MHKSVYLSIDGVPKCQSEAFHAAYVRAQMDANRTGDDTLVRALSYVVCAYRVDPDDYMADRARLHAASVVELAMPGFKVSWMTGKEHSRREYTEGDEPDPDPVPPGATPVWHPDACERCHGTRGGEAGNENIVCGVVVCDYCTEEETKAAWERAYGREYTR